MSGCGSGDDTSTTTPKAKAVNTLDANITLEYQKYVEQTLSNRVRAFKLFEELKSVETLSPLNLHEMKLMILRYLNSKDFTTTRVNEYQYLLDEDDVAYTQKERLELVMMSLAAMLMCYDDYLLVYAKYDENEKLKETFNAADSAYGIGENTLEDEIVYLYQLESERENIAEMISYYRLNALPFWSDENSYFLYLKNLIENSPSYQLGLEEESFFGSLFDTLYDSIAEMLSDIFGNVSETIGNTAGLVETREGKLYRDTAVETHVLSLLEPGDILLEKTPFRLTDALIPGYWGHVAVYIGSENELRDMGIWDDINATYQQNISEGKLIVEALRDGVQLNSVAHFLNIDDLAVMHDNYETLEAKAERIRRVIYQLGKEYDFEYDIEDNSKIICSELVYVTSLEIEWDTDSLVGIKSISPDNIAIKATEIDTVFSIPLLYQDGVLLEDNNKEAMTLMLWEYEE